MCSIRFSLLHFLVLAALSLFSVATLAAVPNDTAPLGKLPTWVQPLYYHLDFRIDPKLDHYSGNTTIDVVLKEPADHLWLHAQELTVNKITMTAVAAQPTDLAAKIIDAKFRVADKKDGVAVINFGRTLSVGKYRIAFEFTAPFNAQLQGLYKVTHQDQPYVMTQMEPISARYAFPSFDEPVFKTPFEMSLTIPADQVAMANTAQISEETQADGWRKLRFASTLPLPTYLVAWAVGPWDIVAGPAIPATSWRKDSIALRGVATKGEGKRMQHALAQTPEIVTALEDYFGFAYPFDKLDILAAPDFSAGAMENPGLITFRDYLMLIDAQSPASNVRNSFNVVGHELAHQWFGDTVTMPWWDDLWLNEAFATWMQSKMTQKLRPEYRADLELIQGANYAMQSDSLVSVRKIRQPIINNGDIETAFDGITYQKGAAVLNMFERYMGEANFRTGIRQYIQDHQFASATADDLIGALSKASGKGEREAERLRNAMQSFLNQPGVPWITTSLQREGEQTVLHVTQKRYLPLGSTGDANKVWGIPVCVRYGELGELAGDAEKNNSKVQCELLNKKEGKIVLPGASANAWYIPNADAAGYYRFGMAAADLARLNERVSSLVDTEQLAYADMIDASFRHGDIDAAAVLAAMPRLADAKTQEVATALIPTLQWLNKYQVQTPEQKHRLAEVAAQLYLPRLQKLGYERRNNEPQSDALLRTSLAHFLAMNMQLPE
ncbi:MAG: M1 family metallopeptidase, partial [Glaciimonas sp.]|nr:M1 family metallopeptidase [Glaciimonas sp.]